MIIVQCDVCKLSRAYESESMLKNNREIVEAKVDQNIRTLYFCEKCLADAASLKKQLETMQENILKARYGNL